MSGEQEAADRHQRVDALLPRIAETLGLRVGAPLAGGEFGATLVVDGDGRELVLKALPSAEWAPRFALGAELAGHLRARGYPAPEYIGTGVALHATWSLQERLPGAVPDVMTEAHARRLGELVEMHAGAAGRRNPWNDAATPFIPPWMRPMSAWVRLLAAHDGTATLVGEIERVLAHTADVELLDDGIVHGDFHHLNFLAIDDEVRAVFDWELATVGDWRHDLVTLAFWSAILPAQIPPPVAGTIIDRMRERCPPKVIAFFAALRTLIQLDFDVRVHPERLSIIIQSIEASIAPWWREPS